VIKTQMTFGVSRDDGAFEWAGDGLRSVFCQPRRIFDLGMWRMLFDITRFNACAVRVLAENDDLSIGEYLQREGYSSRFRNDYLIVSFLTPFLLSLIRVSPFFCIVAHDGRGVEHPAGCMRHRLPSENADTIHVQPPPVANNREAFMAYHQRWQVCSAVCEGTPIRADPHCSKKYVESILSQLPSAQLRLSTPVHAVWSGEGNVILETATGKREMFDHIIFACHSDDALRILDAGSGATPAEREVLGAFRWSKNEVWLHSDENVSFHSPLVLEEGMEPDRWAYQLMPRSRLAWSCWNYITRTAVDEQGKMKANDPQVSL
jgi:predicted NAD/FAD-binding protein